MRPQRTKLSVDDGMDMDARALCLKQEIGVALDELAKKPFGWDGDSGLPVRPDALSELREKLLGQYGIDLRGLPSPGITLGCDGTIYLAFLRGPRSLTIEVCCAGIAKCWAQQADEDEYYLRDKLVRLPRSTPATGYAVEVDEWGDWLLGIEEIG